MAPESEVMTKQALERLAPAQGPPRGLPRSAFMSEAFFALECERLFPRHWVFVGHAHDIPETGDVMPIEVAGLPIILVRGEDGGINAFHNVCRHRGRIVVDAPCRGQRVLTCPYHSWSYRLDGRLNATPHFGGYREPRVEGFDAKDFGLKPVRSAQWYDWLLVNLDGNAPPFEEVIKPFQKRIEEWEFRAKGYDLDGLKHVGRINFGIIKGNWKILVENFIEPYHVPFVHEESCGGQPLKDHYALSDGLLVGSAVDVKGTKAAVGPEAQDAEGRRECLDTSALYLTLFPNFAIGFYGDSVLSILARPVSAGETWEQFDVYVWGYVDPTPRSSEAWLALNRRINAEDISMIEAMQRGLASPVMDEGAVLSPHWEHCVQRFEQLVIEGVA
jgi:choline monooxygenase